MSYLPIPPRVWSRVQSQCTYIVPGSSYNSAYIPLTNQTVSLGQALYEDKLQYKGNILQYKGNSSRLTKMQRYSQLAQGFGPNRRKVFATQTQTYTNPNTSSFQRVNYINIPSPNTVPDPFDCSSNVIQDGGNLVYGTYQQPCTGEIIKTCPSIDTLCFPSYCSDVPGEPINLCWNPKSQTFFPRQRLNMSNSTNKWPINYKGLVTALRPDAPYLMVDLSGNIANLTWKPISANCIPVSSYNIYDNGVLIQNVPYTTTSYSILLTDCLTTFYITALSGTIESVPSNIVDAYKEPFLVTGGSKTYDPVTQLYTVVFNSSGTIQFLCQDPANNPISVILVGGGGGGSGGSNTFSTTIKGGGGGGGAQTNIFTTNSYTNNVIYNINIGTGGNGGLPLGGSGGNGGNGNTSSLILTTTYTALGGQGGQASQGGDGGGSGTNGGPVSEPTAIPSYSNGNGGVGVNSATLYGGGGGGGGANGAGTAPGASGNVAGGGGGGIAYNITSGLITTAGGGDGGGTPGGTGFAGGIAGSLYGGTGANSNGSSGTVGTYGGGGGGGSGAQNSTSPPYYGAGFGGNGGNGFCILKFTVSF